MRIYITAALLVALSMSVQTEEVHRIHEITEGPYTHYSGMPLVAIGSGNYHFEPSARLNWFAAYAFCRGLGLHLASIETSQENTDIINYITTSVGLQDYWLSGSDLAYEGLFTWSSTGQNFAYSYWHSGEPSGSVNEHCVMYWLKNGVLMWNDDSCNENRAFICEEICHTCV